MKASTVVVVGCGVSGLSTGIVLLEAGYRVRIVTASLPWQTVSARAAALWFPFQMGPMAAVNRWSRISFERYEAMAEEKGTGVVMRPLLEIVEQESDAWWQDALPAGRIRRALVSELPVRFAGKSAFVMTVPIIETPIYLQWLMDRFMALGGTMEMRHVADLSEVSAEVVVNCTGLGASELVGDMGLYPIRGQIVKVAAHPDIGSSSADMGLWGSDTELAYIIPRGDCLVLGGTAQAGDGGLDIRDDETERILERCLLLDARLGQLPVLAAEVGLRPGRKEIRLEREGHVIHNYGHGGGGYTVSWGCAEEVAALIPG